MRLPSNQVSQEMGKALIETFAVNEAVNQVLLKNLPAKAWRAKPAEGNGRTIAAIFCHVHNIRRKWVRLSAPRLKLPAELDRTTCTQGEARAALTKSAKVCLEMLTQAFLEAKPRLKKFHRDGWARPWPMGAAAVAYMISHEAHHRGQVCMLAHQFGFPLPGKLTADMWNWERLSKQCGFTGPH